MASRSANTMGEILSKMMGDIAEAKALPDADLPFLVELETMILRKRREPIDALQSASPVPEPGTFAGATGQGAFPTPGGGVPGVMGGPGAGAPNPDELQRLVGG